MNTVLLDTTIQLEQQKIEPRPEVVRNSIASFKFRAVSTYSRLEAKKAWVQRLVYLHTESKQVSSIPLLLDRVTAKLGGHPMSRRMQNTSMEILSAIQSKLEQTTPGDTGLT